MTTTTAAPKARATWSLKEGLVAEKTGPASERAALAASLLAEPARAGHRPLRPALVAVTWRSRRR